MNRYNFYTHGVFYVQNGHNVFWFPSIRLAVHILKKSKQGNWGYIVQLLERPIILTPDKRYMIIASSHLTHYVYYMIIKKDKEILFTNRLIEQYNKLQGKYNGNT